MNSAQELLLSSLRPFFPGSGKGVHRNNVGANPIVDSGTLDEARRFFQLGAPLLKESAVEPSPLAESIELRTLLPVTAHPSEQTQAVHVIGIRTESVSVVTHDRRQRGNDTLTLLNLMIAAAEVDGEPQIPIG